MSGIYAYCLTDGPGQVGADLAGIVGEPVSSLHTPDFTLWVGRQDAAPEVSLEAIRSHHEVIRAVWSRSSACLPLRFGQWFRAPGQLEELLEARRTALGDALALVAGAAEYGVRVVSAETRAVHAPETPSMSGRAYLEQVRDRLRREEERERRGRALGEEVQAALSGAVRAQRVHALPEQQGIVSLSHLVPSEHEGDYVRRIVAFGEARPHLTLFTSGPWPPYSFGA